MPPETDSHRLSWTATFAGMAMIVILGSCPAVATPMRCSGEQKTCVTACTKNPDRSAIATCITNCGTRNSYCMKTGCWVGAAQKYCGLLKQ
jgi:hypothetical protein